jgi:hypothetical protein
MEEIQKHWENWRFKNTFFLLLGLVLFFVLAKTPQVDTFIKSIGDLGLIGAFVAGFFFVLTYTVVPASFVIFELAKYNNPIEIALIAAAGSMIGDYVIFRFLRDKVLEELMPYFSKLGSNNKLQTVYQTPYFAWLLPLSGAFVIASPLPDEVGVGLIGASKMKNRHFLLLAYLLNVVGIFFLVLLARSV